MAQIDLDREAAQQGLLPDVCVHCGAHAPSRQLMYFVGTTPITMTAGVGAIRARLPVCDRHRHARLLRWSLEIAAWAIWIGLMVVVINTTETSWAASLLPYKGEISATTFVAFLAVLVVHVVLFYSTVRMTGASWEVIQLTNVSEPFAMACYSHGAEEEAADVLLEEAEG